MSTRPCNPGAPRAPASRRRLRLVALLLAAAIAPAAHALGTDRNQPMDVSADYSKISQGKGKQPGTTYLKGNVRVVQGTMKASASEATIHQGASGEILRVVLSGKQAHLEQQQDGGGLMTADADTIDFHNDTSVAELTGDVKVVQQGRGEFRGAHMTYNTNTGEMESGDNTPAGRVHMIIQPKARPAADTPAEVATPPADGTSGQL